MCIRDSLDVDLVILNEQGTTYAQLLQESLEALVRMSQSSLATARNLIRDSSPGHGGVYILRGDQISTEDRTLLQSAARAVLLSRRGSLAAVSYTHLRAHETVLDL